MYIVEKKIFKRTSCILIFSTNNGLEYIYSQNIKSLFFIFLLSQKRWKLQIDLKLCHFVFKSRIFKNGRNAFVTFLKLFYFFVYREIIKI